MLYCCCSCGRNIGIKQLVEHIGLYVVGERVMRVAAGYLLLSPLLSIAATDFGVAPNILTNTKQSGLETRL